MIRPNSLHSIAMVSASLCLSGIAYAQTPAQCDNIYAVHDKSVQDSRIFSYNLNDGSFNPLGPLYIGSDLEGLDVHPQTNILYTSSGQFNSQLYTIDALSGALSIVGNIGFDNVKGLAFDPFGQLWSGSDQGLLQIDITTGIGTVLDITPDSINSLAWNQDGTKLFATTNTPPNSTLWVYDTQGWQIACEGLPKKVESLETMPDGLLIYSFHKDTELGIHTFDADDCQTITEDIVVTPYNDIEGIAWPNRTCEPTQFELLQDYLTNLDGMESVVIEADGKIYYRKDGENRHAQLADEIVEGSPPADGLLALISIPDANGDGIADMQITYPNGDQQIIYDLGIVPEPSVKVTITTSMQNVAENQITIEGSYIGPINTGITVNGIAALVHDGYFAVNNVPLVAGVNTITATLISREETATASISITSQGNQPLLTVEPSPNSGLAPLSVTFDYELNSSFDFYRVFADFDSDNVNDFISYYSFVAVQHDYTTPGIYIAKINVRDYADDIHSATTAIEVVDLEQKENLLRSLWDEMNAALVAGDKDIAMSYLNVNAQIKYDPVFEVLLPHMAEIVASYSPLMQVSLSDNIGEFAVNRTIDGELKIFFVYYLKGSDGVWRLDSM